MTGLRGSCASCGADDVEVCRVHRAYLDPTSADGGGSGGGGGPVKVLDEIETWCFPCRTHYPHEPA